MTPELTFVVSVISPLAVCLISILTFKRSMDKDIEKRAEERGKSNAQLESIATDTREIVIDIKAMQSTVNKHTEEIAVVRESAKSAHHRIDGLEERFNKSE